LTDLEYLAVHRGSGHKQQFGYELAYSSEGQEGGRFLAGLIEVNGNDYDANRAGSEANRAGQNSNRSGTGRPLVGPRSGGGRGTESETIEHQNGSESKLGSVSHENARPGSTNGKSSVVVELTPRPPRKAN
jgi:hypothetical protein